MGRRGPAPKPLEQKIAAGNPGKRALPETKAVVVAANGIPTAPEDLGEDGRVLWSRLWQSGREWLSPITDWDVVWMLSQLHDERVELRHVLKNEGRFTTGAAHQTVSHPAVQQLRNVEAQFVRLLALCGFNPSDRARLGIKLIERESKLDQFIKAGGNVTKLRKAASR